MASGVYFTRLGFEDQITTRRHAHRLEVLAQGPRLPPQLVFEAEGRHETVLDRHQHGAESVLLHLRNGAEAFA